VVTVPTSVATASARSGTAYHVRGGAAMRSFEAKRRPSGIATRKATVEAMRAAGRLHVICRSMRLNRPQARKATSSDGIVRSLWAATT